MTRDVFALRIEVAASELDGDATLADANAEPEERQKTNTTSTAIKRCIPTPLFEDRPLVINNVTTYYFFFIYIQ